MSAALSVLKLSVQSVRQLQQYKIEVCFEITGLPYLWTPVANHSILKRGSLQLRQCLLVLAYIGLVS